MKMRQAGAAFWAWLVAVLLGPFVPFLTAPLGPMLFEEPNSTYRGGDWRGVQAMTYLGVPLWAAVIVAASVWLGRRMRKEDTADTFGTGCAMSLFGIAASAVWGFVACALIPSMVQTH